MNIIRKLFHKNHDYVRTYYFGRVPITACTMCGEKLRFERIHKAYRSDYSRLSGH